MDERRIIERLAEIRKLAVGMPVPVAVAAIDALMEDMTFGAWPHGDSPVKPPPVCKTARTNAAPSLMTIPRGSSIIGVIVETPE